MCATLRVATIAVVICGAGLNACSDMATICKSVDSFLVLRCHTVRGAAQFHRESLHRLLVLPRFELALPFGGKAEMFQGITRLLVFGLHRGEVRLALAQLTLQADQALVQTDNRGIASTQGPLGRREGVAGIVQGGLQALNLIAGLAG